MALAPNGASKTDEFRAALDDWLERKSFQGASKVSAALGYIGCDLDLPDFDEHTGVKTAERLEYYMKMRHDIVHRGLKPQIVRSSAGECVRLIEQMGNSDQSECRAVLRRMIYLSPRDCTCSGLVTSPAVSLMKAFPAWRLVAGRGLPLWSWTGRDLSRVAGKFFSSDRVETPNGQSLRTDGSLVRPRNSAPCRHNHLLDAD